MSIPDGKEVILHSCDIARAVCELKGMALCLLQELFAENIMADEVTDVLSNYFETDGAFIDFDDTLDIVKEAEKIFKRDNSHSEWLRKAKRFRHCLRKLELKVDELDEGDFTIEFFETDKE